MRVTREKTAVILDRHPLWLTAFEQLLDDSGIHVVGRAIEGEDAVALVQEHNPDLFVAGIDPADAAQIEHVRHACATGSELKLVVVGDSKQMPPTSFAESAFADDADTDPIAEAMEDEESILSECVQARF